MFSESNASSIYFASPANLMVVPSSNQCCRFSGLFQDIPISLRRNLPY